MFKLVITGFNTKVEIEEYINWYEGQAEQDITYWLECRKDEGKIEVDSMNYDLEHGTIWEDDTATIKIIPS